MEYAALFEKFTRERNILNVSPATLDGYSWAWKAFGDAFLGRAKEITKDELTTHVAKLRDGGMKAVTLNTYARTVSAFLKWANDEGHAAKLVRIPRLKEEKKVIAAFTSSQTEKIVALRPKSARDRRSHVMMCLLLDTGMRIAEALSLERRWRKIVVRSGSLGPG
jgi:site-specific recombinase XerD